jgi:hypothetical protein
MRVAKDRRRYFVSQLLELKTSPPESLMHFASSELASMVPESFLPTAMSQRLVAHRTLYSWLLKVFLRTHPCTFIVSQPVSASLHAFLKSFCRDCHGARFPCGVRSGYCG